MSESDLEPLRTAGIAFSSVVHLPESYPVFDFSLGYEESGAVGAIYGVGRYNEYRPDVYLSPQFTDQERQVHMGVDIAAPAGTPVHAFFAGRVYCQAMRSQPFDYGGTVITVHRWLGQTVYALHGHLDRQSVEARRPGERFEAGEIIGRLGSQEENGGWPPHLHFQLSLVAPEACDLPGVVSLGRRAWALQRFPDPRLVLGDLY